MTIRLDVEEQRLIYNYVRSRGFRDWGAFYAAILFAPVAMAVYGLAQSDVLAMAIAFVGLLVFLAWLLTSATRDWRLTKSVFEKVIAEQNSSANGNENAAA